VLIHAYETFGKIILSVLVAIRLRDWGSGGE